MTRVLRLVLVWVAAFVFCTALVSCALVPDLRPTDKVVIASWNVQNLFDEVDDGGEYPEFDPSQGWSRAQFWSRCDSLSQVIRTFGGSGADVLVLQEVENGHTAEVLNSRFLAGLAYRYSFLAPDDVPGVKTVVLSRYPFVRTGLHHPSVDGSQGWETLRPLVEVEIDLGNRSLIVIGNHWKSRIPTPAATEGLRRASAQLLSQRIAGLEKREDLPLILAVGDFNTSLELSRGRPDRALLSGTTFDGATSGLVVFSNREAAAGTRLAGAVWDPWDLVDQPAGSYLYQGDWNRLDHAFVASTSLRLAGWTVGHFEVVAFSPTPLAYGARTPRGVSDHFPVVLTLIRR